MVETARLRDLSTKQRLNHNKEVSDYYYQTWIDYFLAWRNSNNLALHFGYQDGARLSHSQSLSHANKVLADTIGIRPGERVLDAGCGLGGSSFWLATHRSVTTTGIALGFDQVASAEREARHLCLSERCRFLVADFQCLPFADAYFHVVWAQESLCHSFAKSDFFKEAYRVLQPGGRIVIADFFLRSQTISPSNRAVLREWLDGWKIPSLWTAAEHCKAAACSGFSRVSVQDVTTHTFRSHRRLYKMAILALPIAVILKRVGMRTSIQHGNVIAALRQYQALRSNTWFYAILSAHK